MSGEPSVTGQVSRVTGQVSRMTCQVIRVTGQVSRVAVTPASWKSVAPKKVSPACDGGSRPEENSEAAPPNRVRHSAPQGERGITGVSSCRTAAVKRGLRGLRIRFLWTAGCADWVLLGTVTMYNF